MRPELCRALSGSVGLCRLTTVGLSGFCRDSVGTLSGFSVGLSNRGSTFKVQRAHTRATREREPRERVRSAVERRQSRGDQSFLGNTNTARHMCNTGACNHDPHYHLSTGLSCSISFDRLRSASPWPSRPPSSGAPGAARAPARDTHIASHCFPFRRYTAVHVGGHVAAW